MGKPKICFFNSNREWGGGEKWHFEYSEALCADGFDTVVMAQKDSELAKRIEKSGNQKLIFVSINNFSFLNPRKISALKKLFRQERIDTIIMNLPSDLKSAGLAAKRSGVIQRIYRRGSAIPIKNSVLNRYLFNEIVTRVIVNSQKTLDTILEKNDKLIEKERIEIIYNGIDLDLYDSHSGRLYESDTNEIVIGNLGRLSEQKCQHLLLEVANLLHKNGLKFTLLIGGRGEKEAELKEQTTNLGLGESVKFLGFIDESREFMNSIDIFVLTSKWEGFGYVLVEAAAAELPVVAFNISSNPEVVDNGMTGVLVTPFDLDKMASEIENLSNDKLKRLAMGKAGRKMVEAKFQFSDSLNKLKQLLLEYELAE